MVRKIKKSKNLYIYVGIFIVLIIVLISPKIRGRLFDVFNGSERDLELISEFTVDKAMDDIDIYDGRVIEWKDNTLAFLDFNGFEVFKEEFTFEDPDIFWGKDSLYIMDKTLGQINVFNKIGEPLEEINIESPFYRIQEKDENILAFKKNNDEENVDIIARDGKIIQSHLEKIPILTVGINDKEDYLISTLDIDKDLKSIASVYSNTGEELFTIDIKDEIIIYSKFIKDDLLLASDKSLYFVHKGKVKWEKEYENIKDIEVVDKEILILYDNKFEILNLKGKIKREYLVDESLEKILPTEDEIFIWGKNHIIIPKRKKNKLNFKTEDQILNLKYDDENLLIQREDKVEIYKLKEKGDK